MFYSKSVLSLFVHFISVLFALISVNALICVRVDAKLQDMGNSCQNH